MRRSSETERDRPSRAGQWRAVPSAADTSLADHLQRIEGYMRGCALLAHPRDRSRLRTELATLITTKIEEIAGQWVRQIGAAFAIPETEHNELRQSIRAATERWVRHIDNPDNIDTYMYLRSHARRRFISQFSASRFLAAMMTLYGMIAAQLRSEYYRKPAKRDALLGLLQQEFHERILTVTDFFVEAREEELREHEASYRNSIDHAPVAILTLHDQEGAILDANRAAEKTTGYGRTQLCRLRIWDLLPAAERQRAQLLFDETRARGHSSREDLHLVTRRGDLVPVFFNAGRIEFGSRRFLQAICVDISERKQLESQLIQSEKMAAIGQLAAGIAHEIRNPLGIIMNALYDLGEILDADNPDVIEDLSIAKEEMTRVQSIINNLLEFSRESRAEVEPVDINDLLRRTLQLMNKSLQNSDVRVVTDLGTLAPCPANANALRQIFLNLITNAVQAMPKGGELRLRTVLLPHNCVRLEFRDTGVGIPEEHLSSIFNPFFTTKAPGLGTGLGLSVVHTVVKRFQGTIRVTSAVGKGTTFTIEFPCQCDSAEVAETPPP